MGAAILLQFVVQNLMPQSVAFIISIIFSVAFVMYFIIKAPKDWILGNPLPYSADTKKEFKKALLLIVAVAVSYTHLDVYKRQSQKSAGNQG